ncbi:MAG: hypothetical protein HYX97_05790 [Chloroflexi bacterium]|nr:hypothetical protein [Chloroflexota bacterium]
MAERPQQGPEGPEVKGWNGHRYLTIDEIAAMQPGLGRLMPEVGARYWKAYYAAKAGNWTLTNFEVKEIKGLMEFGSVTRPKYEQHLEEFINRDITALQTACKNKDWAAFETAFNEGVKNANDYHKAHDKGFIRWKLPSNPPPDLDMTPQG